MPIYEYKCQQCGNQIEVRQSVSDAPLTACEKCHGKLEKQWSLSGFQFKGEGWYVTDYSGKKGLAGGAVSGGESGSEKSSPAESTAATETASNKTSESTTAKTTETKTKETTAAKPAKE